MEDLKSFIDQKTVNEILAINKIGCNGVAQYDTVKGSMVNNYLISQLNHPAQYSSSKRTKPRKYLILLERSLGRTLLVQTDNDQTFEYFEDLFYKANVNNVNYL